MGGNYFRFKTPVGHFPSGLSPKFRAILPDEITSATNVDLLNRMFQKELYNAITNVTVWQRYENVYTRRTNYSLYSILYLE
jgi:hypothetical protein